jgi:ABC-2 type transport system permease protein
VMAALVWAELIKLRSTRTALGFLVGALLVSVLPAILVMSLVPVGALREGAAAASAAPGLVLVPVLTVVFGILGMTNEYRHGTITYTYLATPQRWIVICVKLLCYAIVGAAVIVVAGLLVVLSIDAIAGIRDVPLPWLEAHAVFDLQTLRDVALFVATVGLMTAFGVALGALFRAQVATVVGVAIWALAIEGIVTAVRPGVAKYLPFAVFQQVGFGGDVATNGQAVDALTRPEAFLVGLAYIAAASIGAVYISMRRDIT